ncbi:MAG: histidine kinase dimerization/phosphoacceptor domain -containing protein [Bacteroidota bacterium]
MKKISICIFLFLVSFFAFSSIDTEEGDSIQTTRNIDSLNILAKYYFDKYDYLKTLECNSQIADIYYRRGDIENYAKTYDKVVGAFIQIKAFDLAEKHIRIMDQISRKTLNPNIQGRVWANNAQISIARGEYDNAIRNIYLAIVYFQKAKSSWMEGRSYKLLGDAFLQKKLYDKAIFAYKTANFFFYQIPDDFEISAIYTRIAHIYQVCNDNQNNLGYNLMALHLREKMGQTKMINYSYLNVGEAYWLLGRKDSGMIYIMKALKLAEQNNNTDLLRTIYSGLSDFAKKENRFKDALQYYTKCIEYRKQMDQERTRSEFALFSAKRSIILAEARNDILMHQNQIQDLEFKKQRIRTFVYEVAFLTLLALILFIDFLARKNRKRKNTLQVLNKLLKKEIHERIESEGKLHQSEEMHRFLTENSSDVITLLDTNMRRLYISPSCEKIFGYTPTEILRMNGPIDLIAPSHQMMANYLMVELFRNKKPVQFRYKALRKDGSCLWVEANINPVLNSESGEIKEIITVIRDISGQMIHEEELAENARQKEYLLKEIHNRVKNNFAILVSLMNMQTDQTHDAEINSAINELQLRVRTLSLVHEQLYKTQDISIIPFDDYLRHLIMIISSSFKNDRIRIETDIRPCVIAIEMALPMGLIVNELITNAYKYAFPGTRSGTVWVKLMPEDNGDHSISVCDDGVGLPDDFTMKGTQSMGSQIIQILLAQIEARLEVMGKNGACFRILFSTRKEK